MTEKKTHISTTEIKNILADFNMRITRINEIFEDTNKDMEMVMKYWQGKTSEVICEKYTLLSKNYETIINSLQKINNFLSNVSIAYEDFEKKSNELVTNSDFDI